MILMMCLAALELVDGNFCFFCRDEATPQERGPTVGLLLTLLLIADGFILFVVVFNSYYW